MRAKEEGSPLGATASVFEDRAEWMGDEFDTEVNIDEEQADILVAMSSIEIMKYPTRHWSDCQDAKRIG